MEKLEDHLRSYFIMSEMTLDGKSKIENYKNKVQYLHKHRNMSQKEFLCSLEVRADSLAGGSGLWLDKFFTDKLPITVMTLSLFGNNDAIEVMQKVYYDSTAFRELYADVLLNSPVDFYPVCKFMISNGDDLARYSLYTTKIDRIIQNSNKDVKNRIVALLCFAIKKEICPHKLIAIDEKLISLSGKEYEHSLERRQWIADKLEDPGMSQYLQKRAWYKGDRDKLQELLGQMSDMELKSSEMFRKYFTN